MTTRRSRAAVLCLGGWGLQTMLHVGSRLRFLQEERQVLGMDHLPDLSQLIAFAGVLPQPIVEAGLEDSYVPFDIVRPNPDNYEEPFYVERQISRIEQQDKVRNLSPPYITHAERLGIQLLEQARNDGYVAMIPVTTPPLLVDLYGDARIPRLNMFELAVAWAEPIARAFTRSILNPTRLDSLQTLDPLVQTSLYVVASLSEPYTAAMLWPIVSELTASLGSRNVVKVSAILATGSFASDDTASVEEASAHMALAELEALTGMPGRESSTADFLQIVRHIGKPGWEERVGKRLFDRVFLLDREKSNQSLARDSVELAVLAGNAIEAFLGADGESYIQSQLGSYADREDALPYSLIGSASDYVPLAEYIVAAARQERKRIIRTEVLNEPSEPSNEVPSSPRAHATAHRDAPTSDQIRDYAVEVRKSSLEDIGVQPQVVVRSLLSHNLHSMFESNTTPVSTLGLVGNRFRRLLRPPAEASRDLEAAVAENLPELHVSREYIIPEDVEDQLKEAHAPWQWSAQVEASINLAANRLDTEIEVTQFEQAWGLTYYDPQPAPDQRDEVLSAYRTQTWAARYDEETRVLPAAVHRALDIVLHDVCSRPDGILVAKARLQRWIDMLAALANKPKAQPQAQGSRAPDEQYNRRVVQWRDRFMREAGRAPRLAGILVRAALLAMSALYLVITWLLFETSTLPATELLVTAGLGTLLGSLLLSLSPLILNRARMARLKRQRLTMARVYLSQRANRIISASIHRVYKRLSEELVMLQKPLQAAIDDLEDWARSDEQMQIPPLGIELIHLRRMHASEEIWKNINKMIQEEKDPHGRTDRAAFRAIWSAEGSVFTGWQQNGSKLPQRVRLALEQLFNERDLSVALDLEENQRAGAYSSLSGASATGGSPGTGPLGGGLSSGGTKQPRRRPRTVAAGGAPASSGAAPNPAATTPSTGGLPSSVPLHASSLGSTSLIDDLQRSTWCAFASGAPNNNPPPKCTACANLERYGCPFSTQGRNNRQFWSLSAILREYVDRAIEQLIPQRRIIPGRSELVRQIIEMYAVEKVLMNGHASLPPSNPALRDKQNIFVEELFARAKPSANYELAGSNSYNIFDISFGITADGRSSSLRNAFEQRHMAVLASFDPMAISAVRTVNNVVLADLLLVDRCSGEYKRLSEDDREMLTLLLDHSEMEELYGQRSASSVAYGPVLV